MKGIGLEKAVLILCHIIKAVIHVISGHAFYVTFSEITHSPTKAFTGAIAFLLISISFELYGYRMDAHRRASSATFLAVAKIIIPILEAILIGEHTSNNSGSGANTLTELVRLRVTHDWLFIILFALLIYVLDYMTMLLPSELNVKLHSANHDLRPGRSKDVQLPPASGLPSCCLLINYSIPRKISRGMEIELVSRGGSRIDLGLVAKSGSIRVNIASDQWTLTMIIVSDNPVGGLVFIEVLQIREDH